LRRRWPRAGAPLFPYTTLFRSVREMYTRRGRGTRGSLAPSGPFASSVADLRSEALLRDRDTGELRLGRLGRRQGTVRSAEAQGEDRKSTRLNSSHVKISYAVCC